MKKVLPILLCLVMVITVFSACGNTSNDTDTTQPTEDVNAVKEIPAAMVASPLDAATAFAGGTGTAEDPYLIADAAQLVLAVKTSAEKNDACYKLTADIVFNDVADYANWGTKAPKNLWNPIDNFTGTFDGAGFTISGLYGYLLGAYANMPEKSDDIVPDLGLFGKIGLKGEVKNLTLSNCYFVGLNQVNVGAVAGHSYGKITDCKVFDSTLKTRILSCGGIVGDANGGEITNCETNDGVNVTITESGNAGAIAGSINGSAKNCISRGTVTAPDLAGGFAGIAYNNVYENITNYATVKCSEDSASRAGGIFGSISPGSAGTDENRTATVKNCVNNSENISGAGYVGGIAGYSYSDGKDRVLTITGCVNNGNLNTASQTGGIVGYAFAKNTGTYNIENCTNNGAINGKDSSAAGIVCSVLVDRGVFNATKCTNNGALLSTNIPAGIISLISYMESEDGKPNLVTVDGCVNNGNVGDVNSGLVSSGIIGSIGSIAGATALDDTDTLFASERDITVVKNCVNKGAVTNKAGIASTSFAAGIVGIWKDNVSDCSITACTNQGALNAIEPDNYDKAQAGIKEGQKLENGVAGILGVGDENIKITNCKNSGTLTAPDYCVKSAEVGTTNGLFSMVEDK